MGTKNPTAIAVGMLEDGRVRLTSVIERLYGIQAVVDALAGIEGLHGVAIDGPLVITNQTGQRCCERLIGVTYGSRKASCHTSNLHKFPNAAGVHLSSKLTEAGFQHLAPTSKKWQVECYPHPALIEIFGLPERLAYKKGSIDHKRAGQVELGRLLLSLDSSPTLALKLCDKHRLFFKPERIRDLRGAELKHNEDVLDAVICMYVGALYQSGKTDQVFGSATDGYIYVPKMS
ncbi:MAG: DUF429 domain-containing protein [Burkholderiales bacterium]|nr:MAG: DUF429 domain-containing protein [Burkholderiales bacterium]